MLLQSMLISQLDHQFSSCGRSFSDCPKLSKTQHVLKFCPRQFNLVIFWFGFGHIGGKACVPVTRALLTLQGRTQQHVVIHQVSTSWASADSAFAVTPLHMVCGDTVPLPTSAVPGLSFPNDS